MSSGCRRENGTGTAPSGETFLTHLAVSLGTTMWAEVVAQPDYLQSPGD